MLKLIQTKETTQISVHGAEIVVKHLTNGVKQEIVDRLQAMASGSYPYDNFMQEMSIAIDAISFDGQDFITPEEIGDFMVRIQSIKHQREICEAVLRVNALDEEAEKN